MLDKDKKVQGIAVYSEFIREGQTMQLIITPDAYTTDGRLMPMTIVRRVVTNITPKAQWKIISNGSIDATTEISDFEKATFMEGRSRNIARIFDDLIRQNWKIENRPILIEMSRHDADDISKSKTPNKIIYRIHISRKALGFSESLVKA